MPPNVEPSSIFDSGSDMFTYSSVASSMKTAEFDTYSRSKC
jgi:hypothetical protein